MIVPPLVVAHVDAAPHPVKAGVQQQCVHQPLLAAQAGGGPSVCVGGGMSGGLAGCGDGSRQAAAYAWTIEAGGRVRRVTCRHHPATTQPTTSASVGPGGG